MPRSLATLLLLALLAGCAAVPVRRVGERRPDDPRWLRAGGQQVRFVGAIEVPAHVGIEQSAFTRFWAWLTGAPEIRSLYRPFGVAVGSRGEIAISDPGTRLVRLLVPSANQELELKEGLASPLGVAFVEGRLIVADGALQTLIAFDVATGAVSPISWKLPTFQRPSGLAWDAAHGRLFVVDPPQHCVHVIALDGSAPTKLGERGEGPGQFNFPTHVALSPAGHLYVTDSMNFRVQHFDAALAFVTAIGGLGDTPGDLPRSKGLAVDRGGTLWIVDGAYDVVQGFDERGELIGVFGGSGVEAGRFWLPSGLTTDLQGRIYVADTWNGRVQVFEVEPVPPPSSAPAAPTAEVRR